MTKDGGNEEKVAPEKFDFTEENVIMLEAAFCLNMLSDFERRVIEDMRSRFAVFGYKTKITTKQIGVLKVLYKRYKKDLGKIAK